VRGSSPAREHMRMPIPDCRRMARRTFSGCPRKPAGRASAKQPTIGMRVDELSATTPGSREPPKDCASPGLDKHRLGELIDLIGTIGFGDPANRSKGHSRPRL